MGVILFFREGIKIDKKLICQQFKPLVKKYAGIYRKSALDSESEAWLALIQAIHTYNPDIGVPLAGYLESRVKYTLLNLYKREMKRRRMECQTHAFEHLAAPDNPQTMVERKEANANMLAALKELPPRQLIVLVHVFVYGHRLECIAQVLGITAQAVCQLKMRALSRLKKRLA